VRAAPLRPEPTGTRSALALAPAAPEPGGHEAASDSVYAGTVDGVAVRVGSGIRITRTVQPTIVGVVGIGATLPRPLAFGVTIGRAGTPLRRTLRLDDRRFDASCIVSTDDPGAARAALASPETREAVREFIARRGPGALIPSNELSVGVFAAHGRGARVIVDAVRRAVRVALALSAGMPPP
jgi:hypothetical protein